MAFATVAELANYLQRDILDDDANALQALDLATGAIQSYTGQELTFVTDDTATIYPRRHVALLPQLPVTAVSSVTADGVAVDYVLQQDIGALYLARNQPHNVEAGHGHWPFEVQVTYSHGYVEIPPTVKGVCLDVARRSLENPHGYVQKTVGDVSISHGSHAGLAVGVQLSDREERALAPYRRVA